MFELNQVFDLHGLRSLPFFPTHPSPLHTLHTPIDRIDKWYIHDSSVNHPGSINSLIKKMNPSPAIPNVLLREGSSPAN